MYIAAVTLRIGSRVAHPGDEVPEAHGWSASVLATSLRAGTLVFLPPQLLQIPNAEIKPKRERR